MASSAGSNSNNGKSPPIPPPLPPPLIPVTSNPGMIGTSSPPVPSTSSQQSPSAATPSTPSSSSSTTASSSTSGPAGASGGAAGSGTRSKRQELSFAERIQVIMARKSGKSMRQLAVQFGCGKTQILNILGQREAYLKEWEEKQAESNPHISSRKRRSRRTGNEQTNQLVWKWYNDQKDAGIRVTGPMLQREARSIARNLGIANFAASNGWLDSFRRLHNIGPQSRAQQQHHQHQPPEQFDRRMGAQVEDATGTDEVKTQLNTSGASCSTEPDLSFTLPGNNRSTALSPLPGGSGSDGTSSISYVGFRHPGREFYRHRVGNVSLDNQPSSDELTEAADPLHHDDEHSPPVRHLTGAPGFQHFSNMAAVFQTQQSAGASGYSAGGSAREVSQESAVEALERMQLSYSPEQSSGLMEASSDATRDQFSTDRFIGGSRIHSASSSSSSQPFSPVVADPNAERMRMVGGPKSHVSRMSSSGVLSSPPSGSALSYGQYAGNNASGGSGPFRPVIRQSIIIPAPMNPEQGPGQQQLQQQLLQQQRRSVLVSTAAATAAAIAAAAEASSSTPSSEQSADEKRMRMQQASTSSSSSPTHLEPGFFGPLMSAVRSNSLSSFEYSDGRGEQWLEVRPPARNAFRVPFFGYRTHLVRLIIDRHLSYWLEVLGQCVRSGTLRSLTSGGFDPELAQPLFDLLLGGAIVCQGRGSVLKRVQEFHPKFAQEQALAGNNYFTLPDYRYRAYDCLRLVNSSMGQTVCEACQAPPALEPINPLFDDNQNEAQDAPLIPPPHPSSEPLNLSLQHRPSAPYEPLILNASSSDPEDSSRLSKEEAHLTAYLGLTDEDGVIDHSHSPSSADRDRSHSCCTEWDPEPHGSSTMGLRRTRSDSPQLAVHSDDSNFDPEFHAAWIKQEVLDPPPHSNGS